MNMPFDLVAEVTCLAGRVPAQLEGVAHDPVDAAAGEHRRLHHHLLLGALEAAAADRRILALGVLAHDDEVDVARPAARQRRSDAGHQPHRPDVGILIEAAAQPDQQPPERDVVRDQGREADGAQEDRRMAADLLEPVLGHHPAVLDVVVAAPGQLVPVEGDAVFRTGGVQHADALGHDLLADPVAGDHRDPVPDHRQLPDVT